MATLQKTERTELTGVKDLDNIIYAYKQEMEDLENGRYWFDFEFSYKNKKYTAKIICINIFKYHSWLYIYIGETELDYIPYKKNLGHILYKYLMNKYKQQIKYNETKPNPCWLHLCYGALLDTCANSPYFEKKKAMKTWNGKEKIFKKDKRELETYFRWVVRKNKL